MSRGKDKQETVLKLGKQFKLSKLQQLVNKAVQQHPDLFQHTDCHTSRHSNSITEYKTWIVAGDECQS